MKYEWKYDIMNVLIFEVMKTGDDGDILHLLVGFDLGVPEESHSGASAQSSIGNFFLSEKKHH